MDGPSMLFRPAAGPQRCPIVAVSTPAATPGRDTASPEITSSHTSHASPGLAPG